MGRWIRMLLGPLPATILLLPALVAGGLGAALSVAATVSERDRSAPASWLTVASEGAVLAWVAAAGVGVAALWVVVLAEHHEVRGHTRGRWYLVSGLVLGLFAAVRWLWFMATGDHSYDLSTWALWLVLLAGPLVLGSYYLARLLRG